MPHPGRNRNLLRTALVVLVALALSACGGGGGTETAGAPAEPPSPPAVVSAEPGARQVTVAWSGAGVGAASYIVYWGTSPGVTAATGHQVAAAASPFVHTGLSGSTLYYYVVAAVGDGGREGALSAEASAMPWRNAPQDIGQYLDNLSSSTNFADASRHPFRGLTTVDNALRFSGTNCLRCHDGGRGHVGDECLLCHFEEQPNAPAGNHMDGLLQMAAVNGNTLPVAEYPITSIADYDGWCLQCHTSGTTQLGGRAVSTATRTVVDPAQIASGRHRAQGAGCIHCHAPHGSVNTRLVRDNPANRQAAGDIPARFSAWPADNLSGGGYGAARSYPYRARVVANLADADDENRWCDRSCHRGGTNPAFLKERTLKRDNVTGLYVLAGTRKVIVIDGVEYTVDNVARTFHGHINNEIVSTDAMVNWYASVNGLSGPGTYRYPGVTGADPASFDPSLSPLPFFPDYSDGVRDFTNGYLGLGLVRYRFTCSTCHDPHGTAYTTENAFSGNAYPDLRLQRFTPNSLCAMCHR